MHLECVPGFYCILLVCVEHGGLWCPGVVATPSRHRATRVIKCEGCKEQIAINLPNTGHHHHLQRTAERASKRVCVCVCVRLYCSPMDGGDCEVCPGARCMSAAAAVVTRGGHGRRIWDSACSTRPWKSPNTFHGLVGSNCYSVFWTSPSSKTVACTPRWSSVILYCAHYSHMAQQYGRAWHSQACDRLFDTPLWQLVRRQAEPLRLLEAGLALEWTRRRRAQWKRGTTDLWLGKAWHPNNIHKQARVLKWSRL